MQSFIFNGNPTAGKSTRDIKVPLSNGNFQVFANVEPGVTVIQTSDAKAIAYLQSCGCFSQQ